MKRALVVEDNHKAALLVKKILKDIDRNLEVVIAKDCEEAKKSLLEDEFRLFVVDILLDSVNPNDATGLDFIQFLRCFNKYEYTPVVITTSVAEMKEHAYDNLDCYKYLEKPYDYEQAKRVLEKALKMPLSYDTDKYLHIRSDGIVRAVKLRDIVMAEYDNRMVRIRMVNGLMYVYYKSLKEIYQDLPKSVFIRCSKDKVINRNFVKYIHEGENKIYMKAPYGTVDIGITYKRKVIAELTND